MLLDQRTTIPSRFERAIHAVIDRTREFNKITLAVIYGQLPWASDLEVPEDAEVQLALILDDDVTDFVATKLELTKTAYDVLVETGIEVAPFPVPVTHWYLPSKAANPALIEEIRKHGLRINLDRIVKRPALPQIESRPVDEISRMLSAVREDLVLRFDIRSIFLVPRHPSKLHDVKTDTEQTEDTALEMRLIDVLVDFGGRPSAERILGVLEILESALSMEVQLLTASSIRKYLLDQLIAEAIEITPQKQLPD